jgi:two-component system, sporulation sensor kinase E
MDNPQKNRTIIIISLITIVTGITVMMGWIFNIPALQSIAPGFIAMKFNPALCFVLFGGALLFTPYKTQKYGALAFFILSLTGTLIGLVTLSQDLFNYNAGIDQLFINDKTPISSVFPFQGRMAFNASVNFFLLGLGFLALSGKNRLFSILSQCLFQIVIILSAIALIGYLYGATLFNELFYVTSMAIHTAILFFILALGASLLNPSIGITGLFTGKQIGNKMAKRLFTLLILMVIIFGSLSKPVQTQHFRLFSLETGASLLAVSFLIVSLLLIWNTANWLNRIDEQRSDAEDKVKLMNAELEKRVEERSVEMQKSEERYRSLIEQASDAIYVLDFSYNFTDVNAGMCNMTGYSREELLQLKIQAIIDPEQLIIDPLPGNIAGTSVVRESKFVRKDGIKINVEVNIKMFPDDRILVIARDITDRKKMEIELREAELKFRTIAEKSMVGVYIVQNGVFSYVNPRFADIFGLEPKELLNDPDAAEKLFHESHVETVRENVRRRIEGELESVHYEAMGKRSDGTNNWVEIYGNRVIFGGVPAIIGSALDITERKKAEELILREKALSDSIINSLPGIFYLYNSKYEFLHWNKNFEILTGYTADEIKTINVKDIIAEEDLEGVEKAIEKALTDGYATVEAKAITKNGTKIPFLFTGSPIIYENQPCLLGTGINISLRIKAEEELRSSEQKYKLLFESSPLPLWMIAKDDLSIIAVNEAAANLYGYTKDKLLKMNVTQLIPPEDAAQQLERYKKEAGDTTDIGIVRHIKKDGSIMHVQINAHDIIFEDRPVRLSLTNDITEKMIAEELLQKSEANLQTILKTTDSAYALFDLDLKVLAFNQKAIEFVKLQYYHLPKKGDRLVDFFPLDRFPQFIHFTRVVLKGNNINYEIDYPQADGSVLWYYVRLFPITNDSKEILGLMMALYDITERKNAEHDLKNAYERIQSHINSIKDMAWKQSHLIRSPLANLKGLTEMLKDDPADTDVLGFIQNELDRMDAIIIEMAEEASNHDVS